MSEKWISRHDWRRETWKGHNTKKDVRAAIRYNKGRSSILEIWELLDSGEYVKIPRSDWEWRFKD